MTVKLVGGEIDKEGKSLETGQVRTDSYTMSRRAAKGRGRGARDWRGRLGYKYAVVISMYLIQASLIVYLQSEDVCPTRGQVASKLETGSKIGK